MKTCKAHLLTSEGWTKRIRKGTHCLWQAFMLVVMLTFALPVKANYTGDNVPKFIIPKGEQKDDGSYSFSSRISKSRPYFTIYLWYRNTKGTNIVWKRDDDKHNMYPTLYINGSAIEISGLANQDKDPEKVSAGGNAYSNDHYVVSVRKEGFKWGDKPFAKYGLDGNMQMHDDDWFVVADVIVKDPIKVGEKFAIQFKGYTEESDWSGSVVTAKNAYGESSDSTDIVADPFYHQDWGKAKSEWISGRKLKFTTTHFRGQTIVDNKNLGHYYATFDNYYTADTDTGVIKLVREYDKPIDATVSSKHKVDYQYKISDYTIEEKNYNIVITKTEDITVDALPHPVSLVASSDAWTTGKSIILNWENKNQTKDNFLGKFLIYKDGVFVDSLSTSQKTLTYSFTDTEKSLPVLDYDKDYTYTVYYNPRSYELDDIENTYLSATAVGRIERNFSIDSMSVKPVGGTYVIRWKANRPLNNKDKVTFYVTRKNLSDPNAKVEDVDDIVGHTDQNYEVTDYDFSTTATYEYIVTAEVLEQTYTATACPEGKPNTSQITSVKATRGDYDNKVVLEWNYELVGTDYLDFYVYRRLINDKGEGEGEWKLVGSDKGIESGKSRKFEDDNPEIGVYYQYGVRAYVNGSTTVFTDKRTDGFARSTGSIQGHILYNGGTGVSDARVYLESVNSDGESPYFNSLHIEGTGGLKWEAGSDGQLNKYITTDKPFTVQLYVNPDPAQTNTPCVFDLGKTVQLSLGTYDNATKSYPVVLSVGGNKVYTSQSTLPAGAFTNLAFAADGKGGADIYFTYINDSIVKETVTCSNWAVNGDNIAMGVNMSNSNSNMKGYLDDIRIYSLQLQQDDVLMNYNHTLYGKEKGLVAYWTVDENLTKLGIAYDYSIDANGIHNNNHAQLFNDASRSHIVLPDNKQLSLFATTDESGMYGITGIPYCVSGTTYRIIPSLGTHEFKNSSETRLFSKDYRTYDAVDFTDLSSMKVTGIVYYENTLYPVEGCTFSVGTNMCQDDNGSNITSAADGTFTLDIPNGRQYITIHKDGHTFLNGGRYPASGTFDFNKDVNNLTFTDQTKSIVVGRISGGTVEQKKPLGLGQSTNNIGRATIILTTSTDEANAKHMNVTWTDGVPNPVNEQLPYDRANEAILSDAWVCGQSEFNGAGTKYIKIVTDSLTGEFTAKLPPVQYIVKSITVNNNADAIFSLPPMLDARNVTEFYTSTVNVDKGDGQTDNLTFNYNSGYQQVYRSPQQISFTQTDNNYGAYGSDSVDWQVTSDKTEKVPAYTVDADGNVKYTFGYPMYIQGKDYTYSIFGYEEYTNYDGEKPVTTQVPMEGTKVTIDNPMSYWDSTVSLDTSTKTIETTAATHETNLDEDGYANYVFVAGCPQLVDPFTNEMIVTFDVDGTAVKWYWDPANNKDLTAIVLGAINTGQSVVMTAPEQVDMIIHDPFGSSSTTTWSSGSTTTTTWNAGFNFNFNIGFSKSFNTGYEGGLAQGATGAYTFTPIKITGVKTVSLSAEPGFTFDHGHTTTTTATSDITTGADKYHDGPMGDVYVGHSSALSFGEGQAVQIVSDDGVNYHVGLEDVLAYNMSTQSAFTLSQWDIINSEIPGLIALRDQLLQTVSQELYNEMTSASYVNNTDKVQYITTLSHDDPKFGTYNNDTTTWGANATSTSLKDNLRIVTGPSYAYIMPQSLDAVADTVALLNDQIQNWKNIIAQNEKNKVNAIRAGSNATNRTFDSGTGAITVKTTKTTSDTNSGKVSVKINVPASFALETKLISGTITVGGCFTPAGGYSKTTSDTNTFSYTLKDNVGDNKHQITIYDSEFDKECPIFYQVAGQTSQPYEGEQTTLYYEPGNHILSEATAQIEVPHIECSNSYQTGIPSGGTANFNLTVSNATAVDLSQKIKYNVKFDGNTTASLAIGGSALPYAVTLDPGKPQQLILQVKQGDLNITDLDSIKIKFVSDGDTDISDFIYLTAHFQKAGMNVSLKAGDDKPIVNTRNNSIHFIISDYQADVEALKYVDLQYRTNGGSWSTLISYINGTPPEGDMSSIPLPHERIDTVVVMDNDILFPDQTYEFRAQTKCLYGTEYEYGYSDIISIIKDMVLPQVAGQPQPSDGILSAGDEISATFNEPLVWTSLSPNTNVIMKGILKNEDVDHDVALMLTGNTEPDAKTQTALTLSGTSFTINTWVKIDAVTGTLLTHGQGGEQLKLSVNTNGQLIVSLRGKDGKTIEVTSVNALPIDGTWAYLSLAYDFAGGSLTGNYATATSDVVLFDNEPVGTNVASQGFLSLGTNIKGAMHELSIYNKELTWLDAKTQMYSIKGPHTEGLIGYWTLSEGYGEKSTDAARSRTMILQPNRWYMATTNYALAVVDTTNAAYISVAAVPTDTNEPYLIELWMRADDLGTDKTARVFGFDQEGQLDAYIKDKDFIITSNGTDYSTSTNVADGDWHHIAVNALKGMNGQTNILVDGVQKATIKAADTPDLQTPRIWLGQGMTGLIDEVRVWHGSNTQTLIQQRMHTRLNPSDESDLVAYYPMEENYYDEYQQRTFRFSPADRAVGGIGSVALADQAVEMQSSQETPGLKAAPVMENLTYSIVTPSSNSSSNTVYFNINNEAKTIESTTVNVVMRDFYDMHENIGKSFNWSFYVNQNPLSWLVDHSSQNIMAGSGATFVSVLKNNSGTSQEWTLTGLPEWLTAVPSSGSLGALESTKITFTIDKSISIGRYTATAYASGNEGILTPLDISAIVSGDAPNWSVDPSLYNSSMTIIGKLVVDGITSSDTDDIVAAFSGSECRGVAHPEYSAERDAYYVMMNVYGDANTSGLTFKAYDASTGTLYPVVDTDKAVTFKDNALATVTWTTKDVYQQTLDFNKGWTWSSFYVISDSVATSVLAPVASAIIEVDNDDNKLTKTDGVLSGTIQNFVPAQMYEVQSAADATLDVVGQLASSADYPITIHGVTGFGVPSQSPYSVAEVFTDPKVGDMVKDKSNSCIWTGSVWKGSLTSLLPGVGYKYVPVDTIAMSVTFPTKVKSSYNKTATSALGVQDVHYSRKHRHNMVAILVVKDQAGIRRDATLEVYDSYGELRGQAEGAIGDSIYLLTIHADEDGEPLYITAKTNDGLSATLAEPLTFRKDAVAGRLHAPLNINLADATSIKSLDLTDAVQLTATTLSGIVVYRGTGAGLARTLDTASIKRDVYIVSILHADGHRTSQIVDFRNW